MMKRIAICVSAVMLCIAQSAFAGGGWQSDGLGGYYGTGSNSVKGSDLLLTHSGLGDELGRLEDHSVKNPHAGLSMT